MSEPQLPAGLVEARRTPLFDAASLPEPLAVSHRTTVWAELRVQSGSVQYYDLEGTEPRDERLDAGDTAIIAPGIEHHVEPSTDAEFYIQFYRSPHPTPVPTSGTVESPRGSGSWPHRGLDLDTPD